MHEPRFLERTEFCDIFGEVMWIKYNISYTKNVSSSLPILGSFYLVSIRYCNTCSIIWFTLKKMDVHLLSKVYSKSSFYVFYSSILL